MPLRDTVEYVAAAYIVVFVLVGVYLAIMAYRLKKVERGLGELLASVEERERAGTGTPTAAGTATTAGTATAASTTAAAGAGTASEGAHAVVGAAAAAEGTNGSDSLDVGRPESSIA